ncbi:alpha/beta fold hydrolase [Mycolicibacterium farcinogenes]|uniref:Alpha/beta hydrolase n=1 Tax=Mycolicibacterium farcinogenes TaxID=1802 RepID=A0ACD1FR92_MYCFR|nr:alpha/beta hydrolase [Mycolicibacterium farcinogenes]QZH69442.1 alpha/beta hydrolase [Mycolicibacterium farcinogenes]
MIALDLPGFGKPENPISHGPGEQLANIVAFLDPMDIAQCDLVGHSMGTLLACELATHYPGRVDRLVLSDSPVTSVLGLSRHPWRILSRNPQVATFLVEALTAVLRPPWLARRLILAMSSARWLALRAYVFRPAALSIEDMTGMLDGAGAPGAWPTLRKWFGYDPQPALAGVRQPILVIHGERDTICPLDDVHLLVASNRAVENVHLIPSVGHVPMIEAPDEFNECVTHFFGQESRPEREEQMSSSALPTPTTTIDA